MAIINEIKCARCDRKYSGVRSRCPYCGARRIGRGKYTEDSDNTKGKMLIGVLIMSVFLVAASILLFTTPVDAMEEDPDTGPSLSDQDDEPPSLTPPPPPTPDPTPDPTLVEPVEITSLTVTFSGSLLGGADNNFTLGRNEKLPIRATIEPITLDFDLLDIDFISSNEDVFTATQVVLGMGGGVYGAELSWVGQGSAKLTVIATYGNNDPVEWSVTVHGGRP